MTIPFWLVDMDLGGLLSIAAVKNRRHGKFSQYNGRALQMLITASDL